MDMKCDDIFNVDFDTTVWLSYELDKLNLDNQLDIESALLSVEGNEISETTNSVNDTKNQDLKMSVTKNQSVAKELIQENESEKKDINGNKESSSDELLNQLFDELELSDKLELSDELELSDSDNEAVDDEDSSELRERGPIDKRLTRRRNRTNYLERNEVDRSQFPARNLKFWSGSTVVLSPDRAETANQSAFQSIQPCVLNLSEAIFTSSSNDSLSNPCPAVSEDLRASAIGSPESGYESSITGSPPQASSLAVNYPVSNLDLIPETDDDFVNLLVEKYNDTSECALTSHDVPRHETDDKDHKEKEINYILEFLKKNTPGELIMPSDACNNTDHVPPANNSQNANTFSENLFPPLRNEETYNRLGFEFDKVLEDIPTESNDPYDACISRDHVLLANNSQDTSSSSEKLSPHLINGEAQKKLSFKLENKAKDTLEKFLSDEEYRFFQLRIYGQITIDKVNGVKDDELQIIRVVDEIDGTSQNRTNLHHAVLNYNIEEIYGLVEIQKQYKRPLAAINIRDKNGKTALDYAVEKEMTLVIDYLKENTACQSVNI